jgi:hypothetical protein
MVAVSIFAGADLSIVGAPVEGAADFDDCPSVDALSRNGNVPRRSPTESRLMEVPSKCTNLRQDIIPGGCPMKAPIVVSMPIPASTALNGDGMHSQGLPHFPRFSFADVQKILIK